MSLTNIVWRKYNLRDNPYFQEPLAISDGKIPIDSFIGREEETKDIIKMIEMGSGRFLIVGDPGVGKTTVLNFARAKAREGEFFSPENEIEINTTLNAQQFAITTLNTIFLEIKKKDLKISKELFNTLDSLCSLTCFSNINSEENLSRISYENLKDLFRRTVKEIVYPRFKGMILHYDNLDEIKVIEDMRHMFGEIRDFLLTPNVIFFFVGNKFLPEGVGHSPRVRQIFYMPPLEISELSYEDVKKILDERIRKLKMDNNLEAITPHTDETLKTLFNLHNGNLRDTLNSLFSCVMEVAKSNNPIVIDDDLMRKLLINKVERDYLRGLTETERDILQKILDYGKLITPTEVAKITGKTVQNIASKYLPKLILKTALEKEGKEGRNTYYKISSEIRWWKLKKGEKINRTKEIRESEKITEFNKKLTEYFTK